MALAAPRRAVLVSAIPAPVMIPVPAIPALMAAAAGLAVMTVVIVVTTTVVVMVMRVLRTKLNRQPIRKLVKLAVSMVPLKTGKAITVLATATAPKRQTVGSGLGGPGSV